MALTNQKSADTWETGAYDWVAIGQAALHALAQPAKHAKIGGAGSRLGDCLHRLSYGGCHGGAAILLRDLAGDIAQDLRIIGSSRWLDNKGSAEARYDENQVNWLVHFLVSSKSDGIAAP